MTKVKFTYVLSLLSFIIYYQGQLVNKKNTSGEKPTTSNVIVFDTKIRNFNKYSVKVAKNLKQNIYI